MALLLLLLAVPGWCADIRFQLVADDVYAYIGDTGPRSVGNEGLIANIGLVVTSAGAVLIDSGPTLQSARKIHDAVKEVTRQPIRWVFNTGGQDHRWLGNGYFKSQGAEIIAHASTAPDMQSRGGDQLGALAVTLGKLSAGTIPTLPTRLLDGPDSRLQFGDTVFELRHRGGAHTPGDIMIWLPQKNVLFAGDIVYVDRLLAVIAVSNSKRWLENFVELERLSPRRIVPGHGPVTELAAARKQTADYLSDLRSHMKLALDAGKDIDSAVRTFDGNPYLHLRNAAELIPGNANRVYLEMEQE